MKNTNNRKIENNATKQIVIASALHTELKIKAAQLNSTLRKLVESIVKEFLEK